jgi:hypothetical protein
MFHEIMAAANFQPHTQSSRPLTPLWTSSSAQFHRMPAVPSEEQHERHEPAQTQMLKDRRFKLNRLVNAVGERIGVHPADN